MSRFGFLCCFALLLGDAISTWGQDAKASAVSSQPVHPVLIRNEHGPLTRVVVEVAKGAEAGAKSFVFQLDGTDDLGDLESLTLFSTGDKEEFSSATPIGEPAKPAKEVTFRGERVLNAGKNVFWLSCRLKPTAGLTHRVEATCRSIETMFQRPMECVVVPGHHPVVQLGLVDLGVDAVVPVNVDCGNRGAGIHGVSLSIQVRIGVSTHLWEV